MPHLMHKKTELCHVDVKFGTCQLVSNKQVSNVT